MIAKVKDWTSLRAFTETLLSIVSRGSGGVILNYHTISRAHVRAHIDCFSRYFEFVAHADLPARLRNSRPGRPFCFLTFDDGKKSNATDVAPALRELGVPAAFYVPTGFVSAQSRPLWFDRASALRARVPELSPGLHPRVLKTLAHDEREQRIDDACRRHGVDADMTDDDVRPMSWHEARTLHAQGFTIGSHSEWHAILPREPEHVARTDILRSMAKVSEEIGSACVSFSFPNGNYTEPLALHAVNSGAATVLTTVPAWAGSSSRNWCLPRIQMFGCRDTGYLSLKIAAARVPGLLGNPDGTGRRYALTGHGPLVRA